MNKGLLVPDSIVVGILIDRIKKTDCQDGFLLDGFPRTISQAEIFDKEAAALALSKVVLIDVKKDDLLKRLTGRRFCPKCGKIYNVFFNPPKIENKCDVEGAELSIRTDDNVDTVRQRMDVYEKDTAPLINYYKNRNKLYAVDGNAPVDIVFNKVMEVIRS
jgi:adenylate kinase